MAFHAPSGCGYDVSGFGLKSGRVSDGMAGREGEGAVDADDGF